MDIESMHERTSADQVPLGAASGHVMTVLGSIPVDKLGITLMHEHILGDSSNVWVPPDDPKLWQLAFRPVSASIRADLQLDPHTNRDNHVINDVEIAIDEVSRFSELGGNTIVEMTNAGIGRDPGGLKYIAGRTGLNIIMGSGFYTQETHPPRVRKMGAEDIAEEITRDIREGVPETGVRAGVIGEIGMDWNFTEEEQKVLRGAARAAKRTGVPLIIHLEGWHRWGLKSLDIAEEEGASPAQIVLSHMSPSMDDREYQEGIANRGAYLGYDMIGQDVDWGGDIHHGECPSDRDVAAGLKRLIDAGYLERIMISQDTCCKYMLTRYGGRGYGYILRHFVGRLKKIGVTEEQIHTLMVTNPRTIFSAQ